MIDDDDAPVRAAESPQTGFQADGVLPPLLPEGLYDLRSLRAVPVTLFMRRMVLLDVEVMGGPYDGARLFWSASLPQKGRRPGISSKFLRAWMLVTSRRPQRGEHLSIKLLEAKHFRGRVVTVVKDHHGDPLPEPARYSVVRDLLQRLA